MQVNSQEPLAVQFRALLRLWSIPALIFVLGAAGLSIKKTNELNHLATSGISREVKVVRDGTRTMGAGKGSCRRMQVVGGIDIDNIHNTAVCEDPEAGVVHGAKVVITWDPQNPDLYVVGRPELRSLWQEIFRSALFAGFGALVLLFAGFLTLSIFRLRWIMQQDRNSLRG